jgi:signal transduction histidine kinase
VRDFLPSFSNVLNNISAHDNGRSPFRTAMQCNGRRGADVFLADVWFSTYQTSAGPRLAAMAVDASEDLRNREEMSLHQLLAGSRILVGAVSHEIRNVCGAIAMTHTNLSRSQGAGLIGNKDFEALGHLIRALEKIASMNLRQSADQASSVDLTALLEELRIVIGPSFEEQGISLHFENDPALPHVWADRQSLLQVFLNLAKNSQRALTDQPRRELDIIAHTVPDGVEILFRDTGSGVAHPELLFRPFQQQAQATGLGLYLSRAFMRSFRGDLRYEPAASDRGSGSSFIVELSAVEAPSGKVTYVPHQDSSRGRPQPVPREPEPAARS